MKTEKEMMYDLWRVHTCPNTRHCKPIIPALVKRMFIAGANHRWRIPLLIWAGWMLMLLLIVLKNT